jgi:hypothetical protein
MSKVTLSDVALAVLALQYECEAVEKQQLELGLAMGKMIARQQALSKQCGALKDTMAKLLENTK